MLTYGSLLAARSARAADADRADRRSAPISRATAGFQLEPDLDASPPPAATPPTAPSCAATTSRATTGCARWSMPSGSTDNQLHLDRRLGVRGAAAHRRRRAAADRPAGDRRALAARRPDPRRPDRAAGEQPRHPPAPKARTPSAPSPARPGSGAASPRWGQELVLTAYARGDVYHASDTLLTQTVIYRGNEGWQRPRHRRARGRPQMAVRRPVPRRHPAPHPAHPVRRLAADRESRHPQRGCALGRPRGFEPVRAQPLPRLRPLGGRRRGSPTASTGRSSCPASRSRPTIGQSYRLNNKPAILPPGTGLSDRFSDIVGRTTVQVGRLVNFVHRFRLDKDTLALRRNEIDATIGSRRTYATIGYLRLNRNIDPSIEDLRDREEIRLGGRVELRALLVDLRLDGDRPHRPARRIRSRSPTASSRSATGSASSTTTIASSLA